MMPNRGLTIIHGFRHDGVLWSSLGNFPRVAISTATTSRLVVLDGIEGHLAQDISIVPLHYAMRNILHPLKGAFG